MWKYIFISLVIMAFLSAIAGYVVNQENIGQGGVSSVLNQWRGIAHKDIADRVMGVRDAQKHFIEERNRAMKEKYEAFLKRQQDVRDQMVDINNKRNLTTENFLELLVSDVRRTENRLLELKGADARDQIEKLKLFNDRLASSGFVSGNPFVPPDRYDQYLDDLKERVSTLSDVLPFENSQEYKNQLVELSALEQKRKDVAVKLEKEQESMQEELSEHKEKMTLLQQQATDTMLRNQQALEFSQEQLKLKQSQNEERMAQQQLQTAQSQRLRDERARQNQLLDQRLRDQKERVDELIRNNRN